MRSFFVFFTLLFSTSAFPIGYVIGNGGDGYLKNGKLILRDLVEGGVADAPYFGTIQNESIRSQVKALKNLNELEYSRELLIQKLSDLETLSPNLGRYVLEALAIYIWTPVKEPLFTVPDPEGVLNFPATDLIQIANRSDDVIRVDLIQYLKLDAENRIALLIHEALYGMLKPVCHEGTCYQPARIARVLTALLFRKSTYDVPRDAATRILAHIDVPQIPFAIDSTGRNWSIRWIPAEDSFSEPFSLTANIPLYGEHFLSMISMSCRRFRDEAASYQEKGGKMAFRVVSTITYPSFITLFERYQTKVMGHPSTQLRVVVSSDHEPRANRMELVIGAQDGDGCEKRLLAHLMESAERH